MADLILDFCEKPQSLVIPDDLQVLSLRGCCEWVSDAVLRSLGSGGKLREVYLFRCCRLTDKGIMKIIRNSGRTLKILELSGCINISDELMIAIGRYCKSLISLDLTRCPLITDVGINFVIDGCSRSLEGLLLYANSTLGHSTYLSIADARHLKRLDLCGHPNLTSADLVKILINCEELIYLNLSWCINISDEVLWCVLSHLRLQNVEYLSLHGIKSLSREVMLELIAYLKAIPSLHSLDVRGIPSISDFTSDNCKKLRETIPDLVEWKLHH